MKPRIKVITIGVSNLENALAFYRDGLGLLESRLGSQGIESNCPLPAPLL